MKLAYQVFQFLIGRLITKNFGDMVDKVEQFQFLIGRLITADLRICRSGLSEFQFLIGRLITQKAGKVPYTTKNVSIPHR